MSVEVPPGFEPGMEVLQTSALPLGDGTEFSAGVYILRTKVGSPTVARSWRMAHLRSQCISTRATVGNLRLKHERRLERETGFEPATSTLARSHSTTELFPPSTKSKRTTRF